MRKIIIIFILVLTFGCSKNNQEYFTVSGKIIDENTNLGISNIILEVTTIDLISGYGFSSSSDLEKKYIKTDQEGNFQISMKVLDNIDLVNIFRYEDGNFTRINRGFEVSNSQNIEISVFKYEILKIIVKNTNPFDSNDSIEFSDPSSFLIKRENFGVQNETETSSQGIIYPVNVWYGTNVNSEVTYKVPQNYQNDIIITKIKNGILSTSHSNPVNIIPNQINTININY